MASSRRWTRQEMLAALVLYIRMPNTRISYEEEPEIIALAKAMDRTPGSICLMLQNILAYDPNRTRKGFPNANNYVKTRLWPEFAERGDELLAEALSCYHDIMSEAQSSSLKPDDIVLEYAGRDVRSMTTRRLGQDYFRKSLLEVYEGRCCVTGFGIQGMLIASHIKPWAAASTCSERVSAENGLLLNPIHDRAFDQGLITIGEDYRIIFSEKLEQTCIDAVRDTNRPDIYNALLMTRGQRIWLPEQHKPSIEFIKYHNEMVFLDRTA